MNALPIPAPCAPTCPAAAGVHPGVSDSPPPQVPHGPAPSSDSSAPHLEDTEDTGYIEDGVLSWLRAAVMGAGDGIVSTAGLMLGFAGAAADHSALLLAGLVALVAGAASMSAGEYVSVAAHRDAARRSAAPDGTPDGDNDARPGVAAFASALAFSVGALVPLLAAVCAGALASSAAVTVSVVSSSLAGLAIVGYLAAVFGEAAKSRSVLRNLAGGGLAMTVTFAAGALLGGAI